MGARRLVLGMALGACQACIAQVQFEGLDMIDTERRDIMPRVEVNATSLPRLAPAGEGAQFSGPRVDVTLLPTKSSPLGVAFGMSNPNPQAPSLPGLAAHQQPSVDLGLQWRHTFGNNQRVDVTAWRRMTPQNDVVAHLQQQSTYGARVEMNLAPAKGLGLVADKGFLGVQLEGGARITIKRRNRVPMVYYRTSF